MNEIGEKLREARESHGVSIEEAAEDLKIRAIQLKNLEEGDIKGFKDIFYVKSFIRDYAKYLGLDGDKLLDDFNEYLFDYTSRIPVDKIKEATTVSDNTKKISSPYTTNNKKKLNITRIIIYSLIAIVILVIGFLIMNGIKNNDKTTSTYTSYKYIVE